MKKFISLFGILLLAFISKAQEKTYEVKPNSKIYWKGYKIFKIDSTSHKGSISFKEGNLTFIKNKPIKGKLIANLHTISTEDIKDIENKEKLDNHLKSADFFDIKNYSEAKFEFLEIKKTKKNKFNYQIKGKLTIKGITKSIEFPANITFSENNQKVLLETDKIILNRQDFNIKYKTSLKDTLIKDKFELKAEIIAKLLS